MSFGVPPLSRHPPSEAFRAVHIADTGRIAPIHVLKRFRSVLEPPLQLLPGRSPTPIPIMLICIAKTASCRSVDSLSPLWDAELVKPAASLSFHLCSRQCGRNAASRKALKMAEPL